MVASISRFVKHVIQDQARLPTARINALVKSGKFSPSHPIFCTSRSIWPMLSAGDSMPASRPSS